MAKFNTEQIIEAMKQGAILHKVYGVYKYWYLEYPNGKSWSGLRKNSPELAKRKIGEVFNMSPKGYSVRYKN